MTLAGFLRKQPKDVVWGFCCRREDGWSHPAMGVGGKPPACSPRRLHPRVLGWGPRGAAQRVDRTRCTRPLCRRTGTSTPMAPLGFSCTEALLATGLLLLWLAPATLLKVHQPQPFLFVEPSTPVAISCVMDETLDGQHNTLWYRRVRGERPRFILSCDQEVQDGFSCEYTKGRAVLHIAAARPDHIGLYLCACISGSKLLFGNGTALIVGDSWRAQSWVRVLAPHGSPSDPPGLVCAVGNASGPVLVSWPGGPRPQQVLGLGGSTEPLISPAGIAGGTGGLCEVRFNASGPPVRRSVELHGAKGLRPRAPNPPAPQHQQGELTYAQLRFATPARAAP
nr:uncharacterized protein LOC113839888 isoform X7 [Anas platyrhynchos]